jgi:hypothetical protein
MQIERLKGSPAVRAELVWYFERSESAMGLHAQSLEPSFAGGADEIIDRRADATHRHRQIRSRLISLPRTLQDVLVAGYEPRRWSKTVWDNLRELTGIAVRSPAAREGYRKANDKMRARDVSVVLWLEGVILRSEHSVLLPIRVEAEMLRARAENAYAELIPRDQKARTTDRYELMYAAAS